MKKKYFRGSKMGIAAALMVLVSLACFGPSQADLDATATKAMSEEFDKQTAEAPTPTQIPTETQVPTDTPNPTPTASPTPTITKTPRPTRTPKPTIPPDPTIGPIKFSPNEFSAPMEGFPLGTVKVYACFDFWSMNPDVRISGYIYHNGKEWANVSGLFELVGSDSFCFILSKYGTGVRKLDSGNYEFKIYVDNELAQTGYFNIR